MGVGVWVGRAGRNEHAERHVPAYSERNAAVRERGKPLGYVRGDKRMATQHGMPAWIEPARTEGTCPTRNA